LAVPEVSMEEQNEAAIAVIPATRALVLEDALQTADSQRKLIADYVKRAMVKDVDFGTIPGTPKPTLYKPGAEKLTELFRCTPEHTIVHRIIDFDKSLFHYEVKTSLSSRDSGHIIAEGLGACSSMESKYRWRQGERRC